jgi:hypothetical protein
MLNTHEIEHLPGFGLGLVCVWSGFGLGITAAGYKENSKKIRKS